MSFVESMYSFPMDPRVSQTAVNRHHGISGVFLTVTEFINKLDINQLILSQPDYNCHMNMHMIAYVYIHKCIMYNYKYIHIIANMYIYIYTYVYVHT